MNIFSRRGFVLWNGHIRVVSARKFQTVLTKDDRYVWKDIRVLQYIGRKNPWSSAFICSRVFINVEAKVVSRYFDFTYLLRNTFCHCYSLELPRRHVLLKNATDAITLPPKSRQQSVLRIKYRRTQPIHGRKVDEAETGIRGELFIGHTTWHISEGSMFCNQVPVHCSNSVASS